MIELYTSEIKDHINKKRPGNLREEFPGSPTVEYEVFNDKVFDIIDTKLTGGSIKRNQGEGTATYFNATSETEHRNLCFIKNEEFFNQFNIRQGDWAKGLSRPDYVVYTTDSDKYLIIHELSEGRIESKRHKAVIQILNYLKFVTAIPAVRTYCNSFKNRLCFVSAKGCVEVPSPDGMADGFMNIYNLLPDPLPVSNQSLERMGFSAYASNVVNLP